MYSASITLVYLSVLRGCPHDSLFGQPPSISPLGRLRTLDACERAAQDRDSGRKVIEKAKRADVARHAGVAESTVSRALNDSPLISEPIKAKVRESALALGYVPSRQAALFARNRSFTMGFVVPAYDSFPPFSRPYFPALLDGAVLGAEERGYSITIVLDKVSKNLRDYYELVKSKTVEGLVFAVTKADFTPFLELSEAGMPFVLINNYHEGISSADARPLPGMREAVSHACNLGHKRLGYITGDMRYRNAIDRLAAFERLVSEHRVGSRIVEGDFSRKSGYRGAKSLLEAPDPPTIILTSSDRAALGVLTYCSEAGIPVPEELSVIGYDNLYPAQDLVPTLSTVDHPISKLGLLGTQLLADLIEGTVEGPVQKFIDTGFVVRQSTGRARGS
jgi:LacI family transcriptional regulator